MKKFFKVLSLAFVATTLSLGFAACSDDEEDPTAPKNQVTVTFGDQTWNANYISAVIVDDFIAIEATPKSSLIEYTLEDAEGNPQGVQMVNFPMISIAVENDEGTFSGDAVYAEYYNEEGDSYVLSDQDGEYFLFGWQGSDVRIEVSNLSKTAATIKVYATMKQLNETGVETGATKALTATFTNVTLSQAEN